MTRIGNRRAGRRLYRRPLFLVALALAASCVAASAIAAVRVGSTAAIDPTAESLSIRALPSSRTVVAGATARYSLRVSGRRLGVEGLGGRTAVRLASSLPPGAAATFSPKPPVAPRPPRWRTTKLTITTTAATPAGIYSLGIQARRPERSGRVTLKLVVSSSSPTILPPIAPPAPAPAPAPVLRAPEAFTIAGNLSGSLRPGAGEALDLTLTNLESTNISISSLAVQVSIASAPQSDPTHPCGSEDFSVLQFSGPSGFTLPASSSASLSELGFAPSEWPLISMLNPPRNQDGCKQASLRLAFAGTATGESP